MSLKLKILLAPLDWGLGHTSRCLPLIDTLRQQGHEVTAAASGISAELIQANFPEIRIVPLPGYNITYSRKSGAFKLKILLQVPRILKQITREHSWLKSAVIKDGYDLIISDNRYGLYHTTVPAVIMTHQLQILTGLGTFSEKIIRKLHYRLLERFRYCWVVDKADKGLSGRLAHPDRLPRNAIYIGLLSQLAMSGLNDTDIIKSGDGPGREGGTVLVLLSGPEPMRSLLEKKIWHQMVECVKWQFVFVAGKPRAAVPATVPKNVFYFSHLKATEIKSLMDQADIVVCRSGYSTLMDLACMGKKALLVPTPGQTEQEYLAKFLQENGVTLCRNQHALSLAKDISLALQYTGFSTPDKDFHGEMKQALNHLIKQVQEQKKNDRYEQSAHS